jgi:hypothetical protein
MNGKLVRETTAPNPFNATTRLGVSSMTNEELIENCFLICLARRPTPVERDYFLTAWQEDSSTDSEEDEPADEQRSRGPAVRAQDLCWVLINAAEFSWNH